MNTDISAYLILLFVVLAGTGIFLFQQRRLKRAEAELQKIKESVNRTKSVFLDNMNHELRTPINAIVGYVELLMEEVRTEGKSHQAKDLSKIRQSALDLLRIINDVIICATIESGKWKGEITNFSLKEVIQEIVDLHHYRMKDQPLVIGIQVAGDVPQVVRGDLTAVHKIIMNLLENSLKFTHDGEIFLRVSVEEHMQEATIIRFILQDTGVGINKEDVQRIFKVFESGDNSSTRKVGGVGIGLAIVKGLVHTMGGEIQVESALGQGATFSFTLAFQSPL